MSKKLGKYLVIILLAIGLVWAATAAAQEQPAENTDMKTATVKPENIMSRHPS